MNASTHTILAPAAVCALAIAVASCAASSSRAAFDAQLATLYPRCPVVVDIEASQATAAWSRARTFLRSHAREPFAESDLRLAGDYGQLDRTWTLEITRIERSSRTMISVHAHSTFDYNTCDSALSREAAHFIATGTSFAE
jgi:hypothetical protein